MASPSSPVLQELRQFDTSSPGFQDQLYNALNGDEYRGCVSSLEGDDLGWLVDYLDGVSSRVVLP